MQIQPVNVTAPARTSEFMEPKFGPKAQALKNSPEEIAEQAGKAQQTGTSKNAPGASQVNVTA